MLIETWMEAISFVITEKNELEDGGEKKLKFLNILKQLWFRNQKKMISFSIGNSVQNRKLFLETIMNKTRPAGT